MKKKITGAVLALAAIGCVPLEAQALPTLQLDISGGRYDSSTETIVTNQDIFTLYALLTPNTFNTLGDTYYISAAVTPQVAAPNSLGSFIFNGGTVNITSDMDYGVPPIEAILASDSGDLPTHGVFPTYFKEFSFQFDSADRINSYDSRDRARYGGAINTAYSATGGSYFAAFSLDVSSLAEGYELHFDLYNTKLNPFSGDVDLTKYAQLTHDAETTSRSVPEPGTLLMMGSGLVGLYFSRRLRRK